MATETKTCKRCDKVFGRHRKHSIKQWDDQKFCSTECSNKFRIIHGKRHNRLYGQWSDIKKRCYNTKCKEYPSYGGRGILLFYDWIDDFESFYNYMGQPPKYNSEIGRIDNNKGYFHENIRWETRKENMRNTRRTLYVKYNNIEMSLAEFCEILSLSYKKQWSRIKKMNWTIDKILEVEFRHGNKS